MVEVVTAVSEACVGYNDVYAAELRLSMFEESKQVVPVACICLLVNWSIDGLGWFLKIAYQDFCTGFGQVVYDSLSYTATSTRDDSRFAFELVACTTQSA